MFIILNYPVELQIGKYETKVPLYNYLKFILIMFIPKNISYPEYPLKPRDELLKTMEGLLILNQYFSMDKLKEIFGNSVKICVIENKTAFCKTFKINSYLHFYEGEANLTIYMDKETLEELVKIIKKRNENETLNFLINAYVNGKIIFKAT